MSILQYILQYPNRLRHRHGFGVQSPWAYEFVRDALFEKRRYYVFDSLQGSRADEQLFRIVQWLRPEEITEHASSATTHQYIEAAKNVTHSSAVHLHYFSEEASRDLEEMLQSEDSFSANTCLVIDGIHSVHEAVWEQLLQHPCITSSFSLRKRGIALFDPARQRKNYIL